MNSISLNGNLTGFFLIAMCWSLLVGQFGLAIVLFGLLLTTLATLPSLVEADLDLMVIRLQNRNYDLPPGILKK